MRVKHRVGRVLSFFSNRRNWDSPNPSPAGECSPPPPPLWFRGEGHTGWETPNSNEGTYTMVLYIHVLCGIGMCVVSNPAKGHKKSTNKYWCKRPYRSMPLRHVIKRKKIRRCLERSSCNKPEPCTCRNTYLQMYILKTNCYAPTSAQLLNKYNRNQLPLFPFLVT